MMYAARDLYGAVKKGTNLRVHTVKGNTKAEMVANAKANLVGQITKYAQELCPNCNYSKADMEKLMDNLETAYNWGFKVNLGK